MDGRWKYEGVGAFAGTLPLVWLDDEHDLRVAVADEPPGARRDRLLYFRTTAREAFLRARGDTPTLLCPVDPKTGLRDNHLDQVRGWTNTLPDIEHRTPA